MTRVLAAVDADRFAGPVLATAARVAALLDASVTAVHVREDGAAPALVDAAQNAGAELREADGEPVEAIVAAAAADDVEALVLGVGGYEHPEPGEVALDVITRVPKPVVVVPHQPPEVARPLRVVVPLEGTPESSEALRDTIALARRRDLEVVLLHVHLPESMPAFSDQDAHEDQAWAREFRARFAPGALRSVRVLRRVGTSAGDVAAAAAAVDADLIALGWSQRLAPGHATIVRETLARTAVPVLLVPVGGGLPGP